LCVLYHQKKPLDHSTPAALPVSWQWNILKGEELKQAGFIPFR
jgi:hypothetical protein